MIHNKETIDQIAEGYLVAALWASTDDKGEPLDRRYSLDSFTLETRATVRLVCEAFVERAIHYLEQLPGYWSNGQIGHNLFLDTAGHGVGFWDRDLGALGDRLSRHAGASHYVESAFECGNNRHLSIHIERIEGPDE